MNETDSTTPNEAVDALQLARAVRFALVSILLGFSYLSIRGCQSFSGFEQIYKDMLNGRPLPTLTRFVLGAAPLYVATSILVPLLAISTLFFAE